MPGGYLLYDALQVLPVNLELVGDGFALSVCKKIHVALEYDAEETEEIVLAHCEKIHVALEYDVEETEEIVLAHIVIVPNPLLQVTLFIADPVNSC